MQDASIKVSRPVRQRTMASAVRIVEFGRIEAGVSLPATAGCAKNEKMYENREAREAPASSASLLSLNDLSMSSLSTEL